VTVKNSAGPEAPAMAGALRHFDLWTANAAIADGAITLGENKGMAGEHSQAIRGAVTFGNPPQVSLSAGNRTPAHTPAQAANGEQGTAGESAAGQNAADKDAAGKDADSPHPQQ
jgi:hypothetical protein